MLPPIVKPLEAGALSSSGLLVDLYHKGKKILDYLQGKHILFFDTSQPFFAKGFIYFSKTIYLLSEKGLPFLPKGSTFSIKKVYLFRRKGLPFLKKPSNLSAKRHYNVMKRSVRRIIDVSALFYECSIKFTL